MSNTDDKKVDAETQGYKDFLRIAKKLNHLQYGKWSIEPDASDPLRKFTIVKDIGYTKVGLAVSLRQSYHRGEYDWNKREFYVPEIIVTGLSSDFERQHSYFRMPLKPRMVKKIIEKIDNEVVPAFDQYVTFNRDIEDEARDKRQTFYAKIEAIKGLKLKEVKYHGLQATLTGCPYELRVDQSDATISFVNEIPLEQFKDMAEKMGWGK